MFGYKVYFILSPIYAFTILPFIFFNLFLVLNLPFLKFLVLNFILALGFLCSSSYFHLYIFYVN